MITLTDLHRHMCVMRNAHWFIESGFHHDKIGAYLDRYTLNMDRLVETLIGADYDLKAKGTIKLEEYDEDTTLDTEIKELTKELRSLLDLNDKEIENIALEMLEDLHRLNYLLGKN